MGKDELLKKQRELQVQLFKIESEIHELEEKEKRYYVIKSESDEWSSSEITRLGFCTYKEAQDYVAEKMEGYYSTYIYEITETENTLYCELERVCAAIQCLHFSEDVEDIKEALKKKALYWHNKINEYQKTKINIKDVHYLYTENIIDIYGVI